MGKRKIFRKYNGQNYALWATHNTKTKAKQDAIVQRKDHNFKARVVKSGKQWKVFRSVNYRRK